MRSARSIWAAAALHLPGLESWAPSKQAQPHIPSAAALDASGASCHEGRAILGDTRERLPSPLSSVHGWESESICCSSGQRGASLPRSSVFVGLLSCQVCAATAGMGFAREGE
jgi:hypothetical protein